MGRTARDFAIELDRAKYVKAIDSHVIQLVKDREFAAIEQLVLDSYESIRTIADTAGRLLVEVARRFSSDQVHEIIKLAEPIQVNTFRVNAVRHILHGCV